MRIGLIIVALVAVAGFAWLALGSQEGEPVAAEPAAAPVVEEAEIHHSP